MTHELALGAGRWPSHGGQATLILLRGAKGGPHCPREFVIRNGTVVPIRSVGPTNNIGDTLQHVRNIALVAVNEGPRDGIQPSMVNARLILDENRLIRNHWTSHDGLSVLHDGLHVLDEIQLP